MDHIQWRRLIEFITGRKRTYQLAFGTHSGKLVLADLAKFCRANETCFHKDARLHAVAEGRREVWLRIQQHLHMDEETLANLWKPKGE